MATVDSQSVKIQLVPTHDASMVAALLKSASFSHLRDQQPANLRWLCSHPDTPEELLFALAQYPELRSELAHRAGPLSLLEMLAEAYQQDEAILTLGKRYYTHAQYDTTEFVAFLRRHGGHRWLLQSLCRWPASTVEKEQAVRGELSQLPDAEALLAILDEQQLCTQARTAADPQVLERLYQSGQPAVWLALAANRATPPQVLNMLAEVRNVARAADIRRAAQDTLQE